MSPDALSAWLTDARDRTLALIADLTDEQLMGPRLATLNPLRWEIGHIGWFEERWVLRHSGGQAPLRADGDALYDSSTVPHDTRWDLPLPSRRETLDYLGTVGARVLDRISHPLGDRDRYFMALAVFHEDMHGEAFAIARQTLSYPRPAFGVAAPVVGGAWPGDVEVPGGAFSLGADPGEPFVFDNEKWAHPVRVEPFQIARAAVTEEEFAQFVDDGGYRRDGWWSEAGRRWREREKAANPVYWRRADGAWLRRDFDEWVPLEPHRAMIHVNWYEAEAFAAWAGRRLPSELEWEVAATGAPDGHGDLSTGKRRFPWGDAPADETRANLDGRHLATLPVSALPGGDSAFGCRQMIGNVWEWTASDFAPWPGFVADPYKDYSAPWFGSHKVLRGGCHLTRARLLRGTYRNFYTPDRRDVWAGFRTCAVAAHQQ